MLPRVPLIFVLYAALRERMAGRLVGDLASSYLLSIVRVVAAATIVGLLYRYSTNVYVSVFVLARATLTLGTYAYAGLNPAVQRVMLRVAMERNGDAPIEAHVIDAATADAIDVTSPVLGYASVPMTTPLYRDVTDRQILHVAAGATALISVPVVAAIGIYFAYFRTIHHLPIGPRVEIGTFVGSFAMGSLMRMIGEAAGGISQARGRLRADNVVQSIGEILWVSVLLVLSPHASARDVLTLVGYSYALTGITVAVGRWAIADSVMNPRVAIVTPTAPNDPRLLPAFLLPALALSLGSIADFLYGPSNTLIINRLLSPTLVAEYAPALQIDAALLLSVAAISLVVLPRVVEAARHGDVARIRRLYLRSTVAAGVILLVSAVLVVAFRDVLLRHWLGTVPDATRMILPLVLIHTVIGGTAGIGRATLLGMGRFRAYTASALIGGIANVLLALTFVVLGFGLRGIAFATIIAVTARCAIWMPAYIIRATRLSIPPPVSGEGAR